MSHTPGPWYVVAADKPGGLDQCYVGGPNPKRTDGASGVASTNMGHRTERENQANALLIAAAPDLLEACEHALKYIRGKLCNAEKACSILEAAIAKGTIP